MNKKAFDPHFKPDLTPKQNNKIAVILQHSMGAIIVVAFIGFIISTNWPNAILTVLIFILMMTPTVLKNKYKIYIPFEFNFAIVLFLFLTLFLGGLRNFYTRFIWWDKLLHFQSGLLLGLIGFLLVYILNEQKSPRLTMSPGFVSFFAFCFSVALAGIWEIYEFLGDYWFGFNMQGNSLSDTMGDIIVNLIGALIVCTIGYLWMRREKRLPFAPNN
ncbi:MAG: hypothetical protein ACYCZW_02425 [Minisyncoccota bacterium]